MFARVLFILLLFSVPALAQPTYEVPELGFTIELPTDWLSNSRSHATGLQLAKGDVWIEVTPFLNTDLAQKIESVRTAERSRESEFKEEKTLTVNQVPCHYMNFYDDGSYRIYFIFAAGQRGFLWLVRSRSTDSEAFLESEKIVNSFRVLPEN